jgi:hypothetical protein
MARTGTFRYRVDAGTDRARAVRVFSELSEHAALHPLIVEVREVQPAPKGCVRRFLISDRIPLGPLRLPITYVADVISVADDRIVTVARQKPATTLRNVTSLSEVDGSIRADVEITMTAPTLLFRFAIRQAEQAHNELAVRLSQLLTT